MKSKHMMSAILGAALITIPAERVAADAGDFIAGAIIGGVIGANANKNRRTYRSNRARLPATQEGRLIQTSLNYFGFNAGRVDGQLGGRSRAAISSYQAHMGYPITGNLTLWEKDFLFNSYDRALAGGARTAQLIASTAQGPRGLLHIYRDELAGTTTAVAPQAVQPQQTGTIVAVAPAPAPAAIQPQAAPKPIATFAGTGGAALPNFAGNAQTTSLASHCNGVSLLTNSNGGFTTAANMVDVNFALNEQFCLARTYAIKQGEDLVARLGNVSPAQITEQCAAFGPAMKDQIAAVSLQSRDDVVRSTSNFILSTGMSPADLAGTAKICLSSGYRTDDLDVAVGSGLLLVALGEQVYAELIGHHLSQGIGATKRPDLAREWYQTATNALESGATAVFAPGQAERTGLLKQAALGMTSNSTGGGVVQPQQAATSLPTFGSSDN